jgi:hypothetical protein
MKNYFLLSLCALLFLATSCKKSVEGETKKFETNIKRLNDLMAQYPSFKTALESVKKDAQSKMDAASKVSGDDAKIKAMAEANSVASPQFVYQLADIEDQKNKLKSLITKATQNANDGNDREAARSARNNANDAIYDADRKLRDASVSNASDAEAVLRPVMSSLSSAMSDLNSVISTADGKKQAEKKAEKDNKAAEDTKKAEEEKKAAPVVCGYCKNSNPAGTAKCSGCGAQLK